MIYINTQNTVRTIINDRDWCVLFYNVFEKVEFIALVLQKY